MSRPRTHRWRAPAALALGALVLSVAFAASASAAERATFRLLGSSPIYNQVDVHKAAGGSVAVRPARYHYRITVGTDTTEESGHCVDLSHYIVTGRDYQVDLQTAADAPELGSPEFLAAGWLLSQEDDLIAAAADPALEAGAIQVAVWQLSGQARGLDAPTSSPALNARVNALRTLAMGRQVTSALDVAIEAPASGTCVNRDALVRVTGTPGAVVDLSVTEGTGTVAPSQVVIEEDGSAVAAVRGTTIGSVTVSARTSAPTLLRAAKLSGQTTPQDQLLLRPGTLTDTATQAFVNCDVGSFSPIGPSTPFTPVAPVAPTVPAGPAAPVIALDMDSPRMAAPGGIAVYTLRVTNNGARTATGVRVRQRLGAGVAAISGRGPKGSTVKVAKGAAAWKLSALKPGRSATLTLRVRVGRKVTGGIARSRASLRSGARSATASGATAIVRKVGKTEQGF